MTQTTHWQQQIDSSFVIFAQRAAEARDIDLLTGVLPVGVLWPVRQQIRDYDEDVANAVRGIVDDGAGRILRLVADWPEDPVVAARALSEQAARDHELRDALRRLTDHFDAARIFAEQFAHVYVAQEEDTAFNIGDIRAAVVNVGGVTTIESLVVHLDLPRLPDLGAKRQRKLWYIVTPVILFGALLVILQFFAPFFAPKPLMTGDYNVAVAEFGAVDEEGSITSHPEASGFSDSLYRALSQELEQLAETDIQVYSPAETGQIAGTTREERAQVAQQLAEEINADLVVYGNLELGENRSGFIPEFYIRTQKLGDAQELAGQYEFGSSIEGKGNIERNTAAREDLRRQLASRTSAMAQFVTGIGLYMLHDYEDALDHFQLAQDEEGWDDNDGKEVLYLFMGNTATQLKDFLAASEYYSRSLELNSEYARARLGVAEMVFHRSRGTCQPRTIDEAGLLTAIDGYQSALEAEVQPALAFITTKTNFGIGRSYLCLSYALVDDYWDDAEGAFKNVIADYETNQEHDPGDYLRDMAAESYGFLALIYMPNTSDPAQQADTKLRQAAAAYDDAIDLLRDEPDRDERRGILYGNLGYVYLQLQEHDEAEQAYELALEYDTNLERQEQYNRALTQVRQARDDGFILATPTSPQKGE